MTDEDMRVWNDAVDVLLADVEPVPWPPPWVPRVLTAASLLLLLLAVVLSVAAVL